MFIKRLQKPLEFIDWVLDFNPNTLSRVPSGIKNMPSKERQAHAKKIFASAHWRVTSSGFASGLLASPLTTAPAATVDFAITLKTHIITAARVALMYDPHFFDAPNTQKAKWELLIPVLDLEHSFFKKLDGYSGNLSRKAMLTYLNKEKFSVFRKGVFGYLAMAIARKGAFTKALPIVGSLIGTGWNTVQLKQVEKRVIHYFENTYEIPPHDQAIN